MLISIIKTNTVTETPSKSNGVTNKSEVAEIRIFDKLQRAKLKVDYSCDLIPNSFDQIIIHN